MNTKRSNGVMQTAINGTSITIKVDDDSLVFDATKAHSALRAAAEMHGWKQRIADAAAGKKTPAERFAAMRAIVDHYMSGATEWRIKGDGRQSRDGAIIAAIARVRGKSIESVTDAVEKKAIELKVKPSAILAKLATEEAIAKELNRGNELEVDMTDLGI